MENVLVTPTSVLHDVGYFQGLITYDLDRYVDTLLDPEVTSYRPRDEMEHDPSFKQLIPYVVFCYQDQAFQYVRGKGESRLRGDRSIGVGGHICSDDHGDNPYAVGMRRELDEEVAINTNCRERLFGLINDDTNDVGRVHLGVVHIFTVQEPNVLPKEKHMLDAGFMSVDALREREDELETWSAICLDGLGVM